MPDKSSINKENIKRKRISIELKIVVNSIIVGLIISAGVMSISYYILGDYFIENIKKKAMSYARIIASQTDGDIFNSFKPGDEETDSYKQMVNQMFDIFYDTDVSYVYSLKRLNSNTTQFIGAADPEGDPALIGDTYVLLPEMERALKGEITVTNKPVRDEWGNFYTAYAPIYNASDEIVGIVAVDCESSKIEQQKSTLKYKLLSMELVFIVVIAIVSLIFAIRIGRQFLK